MISRRSVLMGAAAGIGGPILPPGRASMGRSSFIHPENSKPGTSERSVRLTITKVWGIGAGWDEFQVYGGE